MKTLHNPDGKLVWDGFWFESAFVALWAVFEHLTHTVGESYSTTVKRCLILHDDPAYHRMILEHLRSKRNRIVHFTEQTEYGETLVYQLKRYVEEALRFHLGSSGTYASIGEAATFLDLPSDPKILEDQIKLRRRALKYIS